MFSLRQNNKKRYFIPEDRVTNPFWAYNPEIKSFGDTYFNFGSHVVPRTNDEILTIIPEDASEKEITEILKSLKRTGLSFNGYAKKTAEAITRSKDRKSAVCDLNVLLNARNNSLKASDIYKYMALMSCVETDETAKEFALKKAV